MLISQQSQLLNQEANLAFFGLDTVTYTLSVMAGVCSSACHLSTLLRSKLLSVSLSFLCNVKILKLWLLRLSCFPRDKQLECALWHYCRVVLQLLGWYTWACEHKANCVKTSSLVRVIVCFHQGFSATFSKDLVGGRSIFLMFKEVKHRVALPDWSYFAQHQRGKTKIRPRFKKKIQNPPALWQSRSKSCLFLLTVAVPRIWRCANSIWVQL